MIRSRAFECNHAPNFRRERFPEPSIVRRAYEEKAAAKVEQTEREQLQAENKELLISKKKLPGELGKLNTQQKELQSNQKQLQHKQKQLQTELQGLQTRHGLVLQQYEAALNERDGLRGQVSALQSHADLHAGELERQFMDCEDHFTMEIDGLQRQLYQLQSESWFTSKDHSRLTTLCQDQELTIFRLGQNLYHAALDAKVAQQAHLESTSRLEEERDFARSRLHDATNIVTDVQEALGCWLRQPLSSNLQVQDILRLLQQEIQTQLDTKYKRISQLMDSHRSVSASLQLSKKTLTQREAQISRLNAENHDLKNTNVGLEKHEASLVFRIVDLEAERFKGEESLSSLHDLHEQLSGSNPRLSAEIQLANTAHEQGHDQATANECIKGISRYRFEDIPILEKFLNTLSTSLSATSEFTIGASDHSSFPKQDLRPLEHKLEAGLQAVNSLCSNLEQDKKQGLDDAEKLRGTCQFLMQTASDIRSAIHAGKRPAQGEELPEASPLKRRKE
ncbi:hypothetical protein KC343_g130 [Hortaea werneckii]|nr:hypothetical protein KC352_g1240 [Hortaea werneckii]KAI7573129.1 hypothetical protein KC317_g150 [Hortaea werneckii]KAI7628529.1 hypothetical protein KC346_g126 [Hortaea werneckii]KAI7638360.1 hypothetical protein KC343_g130 [Hortaea werneckii]KAI7683979.1 hypothetical protein KC319_g157 [Hortaea werneckii]